MQYVVIPWIPTQITQKENKIFKPMENSKCVQNIRLTKESV